MSLPQIASVILPAGVYRFFDEAIGTAALRRRDAVKTAILGAVSHDLRSPLTAILTAAHGLSAAALTDGERFELASIVDEEGQRLARLVDGLLDLTLIDAGAAVPDDANAHAVPERADVHSHPFSAREPCRILKQIAEHALELDGVGEHERHVGGDVDEERV